MLESLTPPVVFCFDEHYSPYAAVAALSVLLRASAPPKIYCLASGITPDARAAFDGLAARFGTEVLIIDVSEEPFGSWKEIFHVKRSCYLRLLIPELVPEPQAIYLDCDVLVTDDIAKLGATTFPNDELIAGAHDSRGEATSKVPRLAGDRYLSSGVLVMNLAEMRKVGFRSLCDQIYRDYEDQILWTDQCVINKAAEGRKVIIDQRWNTQIHAQQIATSDWLRLSRGGTSLLHFVGETKPWSEWCNPPVAEYWWSIARLLGIRGLAPVPTNHFGDLLSLAQWQDREGEFKGASATKSRVIEILMTALRAGVTLRR